MKRFKQLLSFLLVAAMVLSLSTAVFAIDASELTDIDQNSAVGKAVTRLVSNGIIDGYEDKTYRPDNTITRAEFSKVIATFLGLGDIGTETLATGFSDVDGPNHWSKKYVKLAVDKGIVLGYPDGTFGPDKPVTYAEAVKMIVCALNYGQTAEERQIPGAAWYTGYIAQAGELGVLDGVSVNSQEDPASRGTVALLINNALDADVANVTKTSTGTIVTSSSGKTAQETYQGSKEITGVVTKCEQTSITDGTTTGKLRVITILSGNKEKTYKVKESVDPYSFLGYNVKAYVDNDYSGEYDYLKSIQKSNRNVVTTVKAADIDTVTDNSVSFWESDSSSKKTTLTLSSDVSVIYNGKFLGRAGSGYSKDDFDIKSGSLVFVSNDGDKKPDVVFINDSKVMAVSSMGKDSATKQKKIYSLYSSDSILIPTSGTSIKITNKGKEVDPESSFTLSKYDIVNLYESKDGDVFNLIVTRNKVSGKVTELDDSYVSIKDKRYNYAYNYIEYDKKPSITIGSNVSVYLDENGEIAALETTSSSDEASTYAGYVITADRGKGVNGVAQIKLYGISGKNGTQIYTLASNVDIDGTTINDYDKMVDTLEETAAQANAQKVQAIKDLKSKKAELEGDESKKKELAEIESKIEGLNQTVSKYGQLIKYTLNSKGLIDSIDTPVANVTVANDDLVQSVAYPNANDTRYDGNWADTLAKWNGRYTYQSGNVFVNDKKQTVMGLNSSTIVLVVPEDISDESAYKKSSSSYFSSTLSYLVEGYSLNSTKIAQYVVVYASKAETGFTYNSDIAIAKDISQVESSTGNTQLQDKMNGWNFKTGAAINELRTDKSNVIYGNVSAGEIFRYTKDGSFIDQIEMILENKDGKPSLFEETSGKNALDPITATGDDAVTLAKKLRDVCYDSDLRVERSSTARLIYGTVLSKDSDSGYVINLTNTLATDADGINESASDVFTVANNAKFFVIDFSESKTNNIVTDESNFDEIITYEDEKNNSENKASEILAFYSSSNIKTVIIIKR